jgi:hypothetical protein
MDGDSGVVGYRVYRHELDEEAKTLKLWEQLSEMSGLRNWVPQGRTSD